MFVIFSDSLGSVCSGMVLTLASIYGIALDESRGKCTFISFAFQEAGFYPSEFYTLTSLTSWATCNAKDIPDKEEMHTDVEENTDDIEKQHKKHAGHCPSDHENQTTQETTNASQHQVVEEAKQDSEDKQLMEK